MLSLPESYGGGKLLEGDPDLESLCTRDYFGRLRAQRRMNEWLINDLSREQLLYLSHNQLLRW